mgnify:CR=1 FL=1
MNEKNKMFTALFFIVCTIIPMFFATVNWYNTYGRGLESGEINPAAVLVVGLISLLMIAAAVFKLFPKIKDELFRLSVLKGIIIIISALSLNAVFNFIAALLILYFSIIAIFVLSFFYFEGN